MILFGRKGHHLGLQKINYHKCSNCGSKNMVVSVFQSYFHILWVPFFPIKKTGAAQCLNCRKSVYAKSFTPELKATKKEISKKYNAPLWTFSGLAASLIVYVIKIIFFN